MIRELVQSVSGYPGLFVFCAISGLIVPLPEDFSLLYAGMRLSSGDWTWTPTLLVALLGVWTRDLFAWAIGRQFGGWLLDTGWAGRLFGERKLERAQRLVATHGASAVLAGRFLVGFRAPVFMVSGAMGVSAARFAMWDGLGLLLAVPLTIWLGYAFGAPAVDVMFWGLQRARVLVGLAAVLGAIWLWWSWTRRKRKDV